ncbi:MAG: PilZ domain-containing protein [PVC group bacterium]|nr:PilZ domain-containing protein [PVC group bacterium]
MVEKRKHTRLNATIDGEFQVKDSGIAGMMMLSNVSWEGFKATLNQPVSQGKTIECEMRFPQSIMPFFIAGKVIWIKEKGTGYDAGIQLETIDSLERQRLLDHAFETSTLEKVAVNIPQEEIQP